MFPPLLLGVSGIRPLLYRWIERGVRPSCVVGMRSQKQCPLSSLCQSSPCPHQPPDARGNREHLYGFIGELASLIYWQNFPLSACPSADFTAAVVHLNRSLGPGPPGLNNPISEAGRGTSPPRAVGAPTERLRLEMDLGLSGGRAP